MDIKKYTINRLNDDISHEILEDRLKMLLEGPLSIRNDYAKQMCLLAFTEPLLALEITLLSREGKNMCLTKTAIVEKIRNIMIDAINEQYKYFIAFL